MRGSGQRFAVVGWALVWALLCPHAALGATILADVTEGTFLREIDGGTRVETRLAASLLLARLTHAALREGDLRPATVVAVVPGPEGPATQVEASHLTVDELLQLLLLTSDRTAAHSLALAIGPGLPATRARMQTAAAALGVEVPLPDDDETPVIDPEADVSIRDLARLALGVAEIPDMRRRLDLDGAPIADGRFIVRASEPLIATTARTENRSVALVLREQGELELLAAAVDEDAHAVAREHLESALDRYERRTIVRSGQPVGPLVQVRGGIIPQFIAQAAEPFAMTLRRDVHPKVSARLQLPTHVPAPIEVNQKIGELVIEQQGELVAVIPLIAPRAIAPRHWLDAMVD